MTDFQTEKALVLAHYKALTDALPDTATAQLSKHTAPDWDWRGVDPFNEQTGVQAIADVFWTPFLTAMSRVQRRQDIFIAGLNEIDGFKSVWVVSMGHLMGLFDQSFLGIPPTGKIAMLRYAEFNCVENGKITRTAFFCDILHLMRQAGVYPLGPQTGAHLIQPGPATHDGLLMTAQNPQEGTETLRLINSMVGDINESHSFTTPQQELARCWHDDMIWWGPDGIGATYTIDRYIEQHQRPFRTAISDRVFNGHICRLAEGSFGGFFGWPNLTVTPTGGYMGLPPTKRPADMRVVDMYRRDGDKLAENWIFIDMLHYLKIQGLDVLDRLQTLNPKR
ncbi:ester cyclase [Parasulfitobacter algicola]|uniref:Nuclear transport factor 2 family protein n=1 Tax=Parasulfitobacter algicola TaxID=2614809 RepID=A0ABX2IP28_9RHOB|nr:ester cyclase [Sulfitobacter algicola]NSX54647.1 nuclear transport factor 2 family protein [Sulfitobacter algicola]